MPLNWPCSLARFLWKHTLKHTLASHTLVWINSLSKTLLNFYEDNMLRIPAIELGLLQRDVSVRIQLSFFLHIPFSFLKEKWDGKKKNIRRLIISVIQQVLQSISSCISPLICTPLRCLPFLQGVCEYLSLQLRKNINIYASYSKFIHEYKGEPTLS